MRRIVMSDDERELNFDIRHLEPGDSVDVFDAAERRWKRGTFQISLTGEAVVALGGDDVIELIEALVAGLRRVLH